MGKKGIPPSQMCHKRKRRLGNLTKNGIPGIQTNTSLLSSGDLNPRMYPHSSIQSSEVCRMNSGNVVLCESSGAASSKKEKEKNFLKGRRIVDVAMWFKQIAMLENHSVIGCKFSDFEFISERFEGLRSGFAVKCKKCQCQSVVWTDDPAHVGGNNDVNSAATAGIIAIGGGHSELEVLCENLEVPCMTSKLFMKRKNRLLNVSSVSHFMAKESVSSNVRQLGQGSAILLANGESMPPVIPSSSRVHLRNKSSSFLDSDLPPVAEPVQVFVDVPTAPIVSSNSVAEEVDPFMDVEKPLDAAWEKRANARTLDQEGHAGTFICPDIPGKECSIEGLKHPGHNTLPSEVVAYSLQSDVVISDEERDEKPALASKVFCCCVVNCHGVFDSLDDLSQHQSLHHSSVGNHQPDSARVLHKREEKELKMVAPSGSGIGMVLSGSMQIDVLPKSSKKKASEVVTVGGERTAIPSDIKVTIKAANEGSDYSVDNKTIFHSSGISGGHEVSRFDVKKECAEEEDDIICVESKILCKHCPLTFTDDSSLKKHVSEVHSKSGGVQQISVAPGKVPIVGGFQGKISMARDLFEMGSTLPSVWHSNVDVTSQVNKDGLRIVTADCLDRVPRQTGNHPGGSSAFYRMIPPSNLGGGSEAGQGLVLGPICDVCNKPFEVSESVMLGINSKGSARVCRSCEEKAKHQTGLNIQAKNPRRHQCRVCGQTYAMKCTLRRHERVHTGERPFVCGVCGRTYTRKEYLRDHMKNHTLNEGTS